MKCLIFVNEVSVCLNFCSKLPEAQNVTHQVLSYLCRQKPNFLFKENDDSAATSPRSRQIIGDKWSIGMVSLLTSAEARRRCSSINSANQASGEKRMESFRDNP